MHLSSSPKHNLILSYTLASREALCVHTTYALVSLKFFYRGVAMAVSSSGTFIWMLLTWSIQFNKSPASAVELAALCVWIFICSCLGHHVYNQHSTSVVQVAATSRYPYLDQRHTRKEQWPSVAGVLLLASETPSISFHFFYKVYAFAFAIIKYKLHQAIQVYNLEDNKQTSKWISS